MCISLLYSVYSLTVSTKGSSICHSLNVCIPLWILICRLFRRVREASSWPRCLSALNCLITVIIWTGSRVSWHPDTMLALLGTQEKKRSFEKLGVCCRVSGGWMKMLLLWCSHSHTQHSPHAYTVYVHLHVSEFPTSPGHFAALRWNGSMSEAGYLQRKVQGRCDLFMTLRPGSVRCALEPVPAHTPFHVLRLGSSCLKSKQSVASVLIINVQGERKVFMWGNEMALTPPSLWN